MRQSILRIGCIVGAVALALTLAGCLSVGGVVSDAISSGVSSGVSSEASGEASKTVAVADFKDGEVLAATQEDAPLLENYYKVSKVLKPASTGTKNQAQVLVVGNGEKIWSAFVLPSHKAAKEEITLGMSVFYHHYAGSENVSPEDYRQQNWYIGTVTNTDEMFKGFVEVDGDRKNLKWLRIPNQPLDS